MNSKRKNLTAAIIVLIVVLVLGGFYFAWQKGWIFSSADVGDLFGAPFNPAVMQDKDQSVNVNVDSFSISTGDITEKAIANDKTALSSEGTYLTKNFSTSTPNNMYSLKTITADINIGDALPDKSEIILFLTTSHSVSWTEYHQPLSTPNDKIEWDLGQYLFGPEDLQFKVYIKYYSEIPNAQQAFLPMEISNINFTWEGYEWVENPASVYCIERGGTSDLSNANCVFSDITCKEWDFYRGKCGNNHSLCAEKGYDRTSKTVTKDNGNYEFAVCLDIQNRECVENDLKNGNCGKDNSESAVWGLNYKNFGETITCSEKCKSIKAGNPQCRDYAVTPEGIASRCLANEIAVGQTSDCQIPTGLDAPVGGGKVCCCAATPDVTAISEITSTPTLTSSATTSLTNASSGLISQLVSTGIDIIWFIISVVVLVIIIIIIYLYSQRKNK